MSKQTKKQWRLSADKVRGTVRKWVELLLNPRFLLCFGIGWMITNGWAYVMLGLGVLWDVSWARATASAYLTLLWIPMTPEKILSVAIAILLLRKLFPNDEKTLGVLREMMAKAKRVIAERGEKKKFPREKDGGEQNAD